LGIHKVRSVIDQQYMGDINILPDATVDNFMQIISNPSKQSLTELFKHGERATWPQIDQIKRNTLISKTLQHYLKSLKQREAHILGNNNGLRLVSN
jgi:actin-related protein